MGGLGRLANPRRDRLASKQEILQRAQHQGQRGPEFVADVGEESGLGPVELREARCGGAPAHRRRRWRRRPDLTGDQLEKFR